MDLKVNTTKLNATKWQDWGTLVLGLWLFIAPWAMQYPNEPMYASGNAHLLGLAIAAISLLDIYMPKLWEKGINILLGLWMVVSPWALGFSSYQNITMNAVIVGVLVVVLAGWSVLYDKDFEKWRHEHQATQ